MELSKIIIDPEFQALIPPLSSDERNALEASLVADGCVSPLVVWRNHGVLLDGHNRYEICRRNSIPCNIHQVALESCEAAKAWIIKNQLGRRNLGESQRAMLATALEEIFSAQARQRRLASQNNNTGKAVAANLPEQATCESREQAAAAMNVSPRLVQAAKKVKSDGSPKLQQAVMAGHASVSAAAEVTTLPKQEQDRLASQGAKAVAQAAKEVRKGRHGSSIAKDAFKPVRGHSNPMPKTALELPHDPLWAAKALISTFDREFLQGLVQAITQHLQGDSQ